MFDTYVRRTTNPHEVAQAVLGALAVRETFGLTAAETSRHYDEWLDATDSSDITFSDFAESGLFTGTFYEWMEAGSSE